MSVEARNLIVAAVLGLLLGASLCARDDFRAGTLPFGLSSIWRPH